MMDMMTSLPIQTASVPVKNSGMPVRPFSSDEIGAQTFAGALQAQNDSNANSGENEISADMSLEARLALAAGNADGEQALQVFLQKMKVELGIEPEEIVEAFAKLSAEELALPAERTIEKVIGHLDLDEKERAVAEGYYQEMLAATATAGAVQPLRAEPVPARIEVLGPREAQRRELHKDIDLMNDRFFARDQKGLEKAPDLTIVKKAQGAQAYRPGQAPITYPKEVVVRSPQPTPDLLQQIQQQVMSDQILTPGDANFTPEAIAQNPMPAIQTLEKELATLESLAPNDPDLPQMKETLAKLKNSLVQSGETDGMSQNVESAVKLQATATGDALLKDQEEFDHSDSPKADAEGMAAQNLKLEVKTPQTFVVNGPKPTAADLEANVKEIINQAEFLAKAGGGEMKVKLTPEGLGEVNLKVALRNGQLNVEMVTSSDEAKRALEKGITELKASFAEHKLTLEQIRIETPKEASNQLSQQFEQAERQFQQQFLQDFRNQNSGFRREFFDIGPARVPGSNIHDRASNTSPDPTTKRRAARRLDLVA